MGGVIQPVAKAVGIAPKAPAAAAAPAKAVVSAKPEDRAVGLGRAEQEMAGALAARREKRGRASTVLGAGDETVTGGTATKRLLGE